MRGPLGSGSLEVYGRARRGAVGLLGRRPNPRRRYGKGIFVIDNQSRRAVLGGDNAELDWRVEATARAWTG